MGPTTSAPLWHSPDPSCQNLHTTYLTTATGIISKLISKTSEICSKRYEGIESEWNKFYNDISFKFNFYDDQNLQSFPWLLGNSFGENELRIILSYILKAYSSDIKQILPRTKLFKNLNIESPDKFTERLSKSECFQLILLVSDEKVIHAIESLIENLKLKIPSTEIRIPQFVRGSSWEKIVWECSQYGIRSTPSRVNIGMPRLKQLINQVFQGEENQTQLMWILRRFEGEDIHEKLGQYLFSQNPRDIIKELLLSDPKRLETAIKILRYGKFSFPETENDEEYLISKFLWKLDFNTNSFPSFQERFWKHHSNLLDISRNSTCYNENDKEKIRGTSVNFFVSLEEVLEFSLSFITWVLLSDHYGFSRFICDLDEARRFMASKLNQISVTLPPDVEPLQFNPDGKNTLYPLIAGFRLLGNYCKYLLIQDPAQFRRPRNEYPGFYNKTNLEVFPFLHTNLIFDLKESTVTSLIDTLFGISSRLESANVGNIRNRLQHYRKSDEFPNSSEIENACMTISDIITKMETFGICPLIYFRQNSNTDKYNRITISYENYKGNKIVFRRPSDYSNSMKLGSRLPIIITPGLQLRNLSEPMFFKFVESSEYSVLYKDYPKRRFLEEEEEIE